MLPKMLGLAFLMAGLAACAGSSGFGFRADCVVSAALQSPQGPLVLQQWLLEEHGGKGKARPTQKSTPPEAGIESLLAGLKKIKRIMELDAGEG